MATTANMVKKGAMVTTSPWGLEEGSWVVS